MMKSTFTLNNGSVARLPGSRVRAAATSTELSLRHASRLGTSSVTRSVASISNSASLQMATHRAIASNLSTSTTR